MLSLATVVLTLLTASSVLARPNPSPALFPSRRQTTLSGCSSQCAAMQSDISAAGSNVASLCTSSVVSDYATCLNCEVAAAKAGPADAAAAEAQAAQQIMNALVSSCSAVNQPITGVNITGAGGSGPVGTADTPSTATATGSADSGTQTAAAGSAGASTTGTGGTVAGGPAKTNGADAHRTQLGVGVAGSLILGTVALLL
ncbi:hypothetical protein HMN09_00149800 [Mycena chlorophos]|uniref:Uncharacterized protein n=1 Tax=Mycena chlorophos TaxID=658473 RepID=A0A8H6TRZ3_MYCCL|nr:hypothetical protein HMN09_00149800 [Mycena chlorophos]